MTSILLTYIPMLIYLFLIIALAVSGVRLMWIAGSYFKRKHHLLKQDLAERR